MKRETSYYVYGALALVGAIVFSTLVSPEFRSRWKELAVFQNFEQDSKDLEKLDKDSCLQRRAELMEKFCKAYDAHDEAQTSKLQEELAEVDRILALTDDLDFTGRWQALERYVSFLINSDDVERMEAMKKEIEAKDWNDREKTRLLYLIKTYVVRARTEKAIAEKNDEELTRIVGELEQLAIEDGETVDALVFKNVDVYISPIERYDAKMGDDAKRAMRKGFHLSKRPSPQGSLKVEYPPETTLFSVGGLQFSYDRNLLDVPRDETFQFYRDRVANLQNLLLRVPADSTIQEARELRDEIQNALFDAYEYLPQAIDLTPGKIIPASQDRIPILKESCQKLASAGEVERLERLSTIPDLSDTVENYIIQARSAQGMLSRDVADLDSSVDQMIQWALGSEDDVAVTESVTFFVKTLQDAATTEEQKARLSDVKDRLRESFKNADVLRKRRLANIEALK